MVLHHPDFERTDTLWTISQCFTVQNGSISVILPIKRPGFADAMNLVLALLCVEQSLNSRFPLLLVFVGLFINSISEIY